jgi:pilus assembly protein CpaF
MSLRERLSEVADTAAVAEVRPESSVSHAGRDAIKRNLHYLLIEEMGTELSTSTDEAVTRRAIETKLAELIGRESTPLSLADRREISADVIDNILGYGPLQSLLEDPDVTEIMVNDPATVYVERRGLIHLTDRRFIDETHLLHVIDKIVGQVGRRIDEASPMVDARLPDGSRVNAVIHPLAINGPMLTIRKFAREPYTIRDLVAFGTIDERLASFVEACVLGKLNILISGGTGTGKTTLLNVVSAFIPDGERVITIEDAAELRLGQSHVLRLESRPPNIEGTGQITIRDLVRNSLRMRPDRIVVGEVRGSEALDMLQAMNTGHEGSLSTIHANSPRDSISRLETMVLMSGFDLPVRAVREQIASALDMIIQLERLRDGSRRVVQVAEVDGMEGDTVVMQDVFYYDFSMGVDESGVSLGRLKSTGLRPKFMERLGDLGIHVPAEVFAFEPPARR